MQFDPKQKSLTYLPFLGVHKSVLSKRRKNLRDEPARFSVNREPGRPFGIGWSPASDAPSPASQGLRCRRAGGRLIGGNERTASRGRERDRLKCLPVNEQEQLSDLMTAHRPFARRLTPQKSHQSEPARAKRLGVRKLDQFLADQGKVRTRRERVLVAAG
jgi:hypothetical protein